MCGCENGISRIFWKKYACRIYPLATCKNSTKLFELLAGKNELINWTHFEDYCRNLMKQWIQAKVIPENLKKYESQFRKDRFLYSYTSVADYSCIPHSVGTMHLTDKSLLFFGIKFF